MREARRLNIPVIGLVDTNCDPDDADFVIPGNDDAIRSSALIVRLLADAIAEGKNRGVKVSDFVSENGDEAEPAAPPPRAARRPAGADEPAAEAAAERRRPSPRPRPSQSRRRRPSRPPRPSRRSAHRRGGRRERLQAHRRRGEAAARDDAGRDDGLQATPSSRPAATWTRRSSCCARRASPRPASAPAAAPARAWSRRYVHAGGRIGAMVEIGCETDFVARNDQFQAFARKVALQIASGRDLRFVSEADVPDEFRAAEIDIYRGEGRRRGQARGDAGQDRRGHVRASRWSTPCS